ncbi:MAG: hypothetical protein M1829_006704 [Trizodia sp. TS-e1964]|nr:MAG: hypothetical protein M1829_006704 [Trizodia sp. TS-e1964]
MSKHLSPTAQLLKTSRFFALPPPLPRPGHDLVSFQVSYSDTATPYHPTHAAIATPPSSLCRGDWGLKRPLPLRSTTNTSTPVLEIHAVDTFEHITDYKSAANHALTLRKWQEMDMPLTVQEEGPPLHRMYGASTSQLRLRSVFEPDLDLNQAQPTRGTGSSIRWRFKGPWLPAMSNESFKNYVKRKVRGREAEFREYVRGLVVKKLRAEKRRLAIDQGLATSQATVVSDEELHEYIVALRDDMQEMGRILQNFLDLPAMPDEDVTLDHRRDHTALTAALYAENGPPRTHPSAGLSYLRTASFYPNHPLLGPQLEKPPVLSRVLVPRKSATGYHNIAKFGVAGVVASDGQQAAFKNDQRHGIAQFDASIQGGAKFWMSPKRASIDSVGKISLVLNPNPPSDVAVAVKEGRLQDLQQLEEPKPPTDPPMRIARNMYKTRSKHFSSKSTYGFGSGPIAASPNSNRSEIDGLTSLIGGN